MRLSRRHIYVIVSAVSVLVLCLVLVQLYWVKDVYRFKKVMFDNNVNEVLTGVTNYADKEIFSYNLYGRSYIQPGDGVTVLRANPSTGSVDTIQLFNVFPYVTKPDTCFYSTGFSEFDRLTLADITMRFEYVKESSDIDANQKNRQFNTLELSTYKNSLDDNTPIRERISLPSLDSVMNVLMKDAGIKSTYVYGLKKKGINGFEYISDTAKAAYLKEATYSRQLFTSRAFVTPYEIHLFIFNKDKAITTSLTWALGASVLIVVVLVLAFLYFARTILLQKKISTMKTDFINNMTHEFMTPVTNISLAVETLEKGRCSKEEEQKIISLIWSENSHLRDDINKVLQVATLEKGEILINPSALNINDILERVVRNFEMQIQDKGGYFEFGFASEDIIIIGDETHIINLFYNIIDNAIKYSGDKPPVVSIKTGIKNNMPWAEVADNGIGMSHDMQKHIFEKFYRGHKGNVHDVKGFGLGLSYVKSIADAHNITIDVQTNPGNGTKFTLWFNK